MKSKQKDVSFEMVATQWFDPNAIRLPAYKVGRLNYGSGRSYVKIVGDDIESPFRLYTSLTTAIQTCCPMDYGLLLWYMKLGEEEANRQLELSQHYGTLMHLIFGAYLIDGTFDLGGMDDNVEAYCKNNEYYQPECNQWGMKLRHDLVAFVRFCQIYSVQAIAIENVMVSDRGYGTLVDLLCKMAWPVDGDWGEVYKSGDKKGLPKITKKWMDKTAVINFKSGRHKFWRSNGVQVRAEKQLVEENFPDIKVDLALNWSPKDWIKEPDFNVQEWTDADITDREIELVLGLADIRFAQAAQEKEYTKVDGVIQPDKDVLECVKTWSAEAYAREKYSSYMAEREPVATPIP